MPFQPKRTSVQEHASGDAEQQAQADGQESASGDDNEEPCPFCIFMKGGGCRDAFVAWETLTNALHKCMEKPENREYYLPMLEEEEKFAAEQAEKREPEAKVSEDRPTSAKDSA
jgi:mitochondrial intermembrane space import and assembly protein 40